MLSKDFKGNPSKAEFGKMRSYLAQRGFSQAQIKEATGDETLTREEIVDKLIAWLRETNI